MMRKTALTLFLCVMRAILTINQKPATAQMPATAHQYDLDGGSGGLTQSALSPLPKK